MIAFFWVQIFVGGVDSTVTDDVLRQLFSPYGELINVKIPVGKRCAFVQFASRFAISHISMMQKSLTPFLETGAVILNSSAVCRASAEEALVAVQGTQLAGQSIRLSWGRSPSSKQVNVICIVLFILLFIFPFT